MQVSCPQLVETTESDGRPERENAAAGAARGLRYFDFNATAPMLAEARAAWLDAADHYFANPSSPHRLGARADAALEQARARLAALLGCQAPDLIWTSGATESNNMVLHHAFRRAPVDGEVWVSSLEHPCALAAARHWFSGRVRLMPATSGGVIELGWLEQELRRTRPVLVAMMAANNETGVLQPWREAMILCRACEAPFFCDAAQWVGKMPSPGLGECDFVSGCAHKFGGPKGIGFLKCPAKGAFQPMLLGGRQERGRRAGTENVAGVLSMLAALERCEDWLRSGGHLARAIWREAFEKTILRTLPGLEIAGAGEPRLWNTVAALMPEADCRQRWVVKLDKAGFAVSTGSACASGREEPSHVLAAMGYAPSTSSRMLRFSIGWPTAETAWQELAAGLQAVQAQLAAKAP